jgi:hypothetical protein
MQIATLHRTFFAAVVHKLIGYFSERSAVLPRIPSRPLRHSAALLSRQTRDAALRSPCYVCKQKHPAGLSRLQAKVTFNADCGLVCHGWIAICAFVLGFGGKARTHSSPHSESVRDRTRPACRGKIDATWTVGAPRPDTTGTVRRRQASWCSYGRHLPDCPRGTGSAS